MRGMRVSKGRRSKVSRRTSKRLELIGKVAGLVMFGTVVLCAVSFLTTGLSSPPRPLHDRVKAAPTAPTIVSQDSPKRDVQPGDAERESKYLANLKAHGMTNQNTTTSDEDMIGIGWMVCTDFRNGEKVTYDTELPIVEAYTDGDPVYATLYMYAATAFLCQDVIK